jgi:hypothetical protein
VRYPYLEEAQRPMVTVGVWEPKAIGRELP